MSVLGYGLIKRYLKLPHLWNTCYENTSMYIMVFIVVYVSLSFLSLSGVFLFYKSVQTGTSLYVGLTRQI